MDSIVNENAACEKVELSFCSDWVELIQLMLVFEHFEVMM